MPVESAVLTAATVMDRVAALMNDVAKTKYTYTVQLPYLNMSLQELQEYFEQNNIPATDEVEATITIPANATTIEFGASAPNPALPDDLVEPQQLFVKQQDNFWAPLQRVDTLPYYQEGIEINQILEYVWEDQKIKFLPANEINYIKIKYIKQLFAEFTDSADSINIINSASFLEYRTAGLLAQYVEEDTNRAESLNNNAGIAMDRVISIGTKGRQPIVYRRRPFRIGFKQWYYG